MKWKSDSQRKAVMSKLKQKKATMIIFRYKDLGSDKPKWRKPQTATFAPMKISKIKHMAEQQKKKWVKRKFDFQYKIK